MGVGPEKVLGGGKRVCPWRADRQRLHRLGRHCADRLAGAVGADDIGRVAVIIGEGLDIAFRVHRGHTRDPARLVGRTRPAANDRPRLLAEDGKAKLLWARAIPLKTRAFAIDADGEVVLVGVDRDTPNGGRLF